jgi:hypothetical protein
MEAQPGNFTIAVHGGVSHIERNLTFGNDEITLKIVVHPKDNADLTIIQLQRASLQIAIQHLQDLLAKSEPKA